MISAGQGAVTARDIGRLVDEINELAQTEDAVQLLRSDPQLLDQITIVNCCRDLLEPDDDLLVESLERIVQCLKANVRRG